jgi:hypothetical protein
MKRKQSIEPDLYVINKKPSEKELEEFYEFIEIVSRYKKQRNQSTTTKLMLQ